MAAGVINYDVVTLSETMVKTALAAKLPRIVDWKRLEVPDTLIHPKKAGISLRTPVYGIAYNRELVSDKVAQTLQRSFGPWDSPWYARSWILA